MLPFLIRDRIMDFYTLPEYYKIELPKGSFREDGYNGAVSKTRVVGIQKATYKPYQNIYPANPELVPVDAIIFNIAYNFNLVWLFPESSFGNIEEAKFVRDFIYLSIVENRYGQGTFDTARSKFLESLDKREVNL